MTARNYKRIIPDLPNVTLSKDAPMVVNEHGGKQSKLDYRCDLLPAAATLHVANILHHGALKYAPDNWRKIPCEDHLNHAMVHIFAHLAKNLEDDHLGHAACRMMMALEMLLTTGAQPDTSP